MSQRSEVYQQLRQAVKKLSKIEGTSSTLDLISVISDLWPLLIKTRSVMVKTLINRGDLKDTKEIEPFDYLNLYLQIHNPKREHRLCEKCCGPVEFGITECPFCGERVNGPNSKEFLNEVVLNFDLKDKRPDWDIDLSAKEILEKNKPLPPMIKPITKVSLTPGPTGLPKRQNRRTMSRAARDVIAWVKKKELAQHIPYTGAQLKKMSRGELMCLASIFKDKTDLVWTELNFKPVDELSQFILGHQGDKPIDVGPIPKGKMPDLDLILSSEDDVEVKK